jgi:hypothetical protein
LKKLEPQTAGISQPCNTNGIDAMKNLEPMANKGSTYFGWQIRKYFGWQIRKFLYMS